MLPTAQINLKNLVSDNDVDAIFAKIQSADVVAYGENDAEEIVRGLINKGADISKLLTQYGTTVFSGEGKYALLKEFYNEWVLKQDLEIDRMSRTLILRNAFANRSNAKEISVDQFLSKIGDLPIDIIDGAMQRPNDMSESDHIKFLSDLESYIAGKPRKADIAILALKNLLELENHFVREKEIAADADTTKYESLITATQEAAKKYRKTLLGKDFDSISVLTEGQQKVLTKIANNGRLRRAFVRQMMNGLDGNTNAVLAAEGKDNLSNIAVLMCRLNYKDMANFTLLMSGVIDELQSHHNLDPSWSGAAKRWGSWGVSYPIGLIYYVFDCLSAVLECVSVYAQKAGYGVYDWAMGKTDNREIAFKTYDDLKSDVSEILEEIKTKDKLPDDNISKESKLRNAILEFLKDPNAANAFDTLKSAINPSDFSEPFKTKLEALKNENDSQVVAKAAYDLLQDPQMNQGFEKYLELSWGAAGKGLGILK